MLPEVTKSESGMVTGVKPSDGNDVVMKQSAKTRRMVLSIEIGTRSLPRYVVAANNSASISVSIRRERRKQRHPTPCRRDAEAELLSFALISTQLKLQAQHLFLA